MAARALLTAALPGWTASEGLAARGGAVRAGMPACNPAAAFRAASELIACDFTEGGKEECGGTASTSSGIVAGRLGHVRLIALA